MVHVIRFAVGAVLLCIAAGCDSGPALEPATGTVTYHDKPLAGAAVTFMSEQGQPATGMTDATGKYSISTSGKSGATLGKHGVMITKGTSTVDSSTQDAPTPEDMMKMAQKAGKSIARTQKSEIPPKYATPQGSGLTAEVTADAAKNVFDFKLVD